MTWYYSHPQTWVNENKDLASFTFFGLCFLFTGFNMVLSSSGDNLPIHNEILKFHGTFILLLGTIYALHYSGLMLTTNKEKLIMICAGVLVIIIIILVSAWRHGFFNPKTYDR